MFINYLKLAFRVLLRNKFFTAITLFGISFTLAILMLIVSFLETELGDSPPFTNRDRVVIMPMLTMEKQYVDTMYTYDTSYIEMDLVIDTAFTTKKAGKSMSTSSYALDFLEENFSDIPSVENYTFFNPYSRYNAFVNGTKLNLMAAYVDHRFWEVLNFEFIEGQGFGESVYNQQSQVAVITVDLADKYFGRKHNVLGEGITMDSRTYKVIGLIKEPGLSWLLSDIFVPSSVLSSEDRGEESGFGSFMAIYLPPKGVSIDRVKVDIKFIGDQIPMPPESDFNKLIPEYHSYYEYFAQNIFYDEDSSKSLSIMMMILSGIIGLFVLLPTLNLINLNVSRILERSSEIGVRKAFGASRTTIMTQFIFENIVQTLLGGVIGLSIALVLIYLINDSRLLGSVILKANISFFFYSLLVCLLFGVLSGALPAYRMSKIHVVDALKQSRL